MSKRTKKLIAVLTQLKYNPSSITVDKARRIIQKLYLAEEENKSE